MARTDAHPFDAAVLLGSTFGLAFLLSCGAAGIATLFGTFISIVLGDTLLTYPWRNTFLFNLAIVAFVAGLSEVANSRSDERAKNKIKNWGLSSLAIAISTVSAIGVYTIDIFRTARAGSDIVGGNQRNIIHIVMSDMNPDSATRGVLLTTAALAALSLLLATKAAFAARRFNSTSFGESNKSSQMTLLMASISLLIINSFLLDPWNATAFNLDLDSTILK